MSAYLAGVGGCPVVDEQILFLVLHKVGRAGQGSVREHKRQGRMIATPMHAVQAQRQAGMCHLHTPARNSRCRVPSAPSKCGSQAARHTWDAGAWKLRRASDTKKLATSCGWMDTSGDDRLPERACIGRWPPGILRKCSTASV